MKTALVLGGTAAHIALLNELKSRGYHTILIDYYDNPVAKPYADEHLPESTLDQDRVLQIARERNADLVISACVDQANLVAAYAMEGLGKKPPYSYAIADAITNKGNMKRIMLDNGIPTAKYLYVEDGQTPDISDFTFPIMVKPADACGAAGVKKCETLEQFEEFFPFAVASSRNRRAVVEEYVSGVEVSAYCFVSKGKAIMLATAERLSVIDGDQSVIKCYGTIMPSSVGNSALRIIEGAATDIAKAYQLDNTPLHVQALVDGERVNIIEFAPRVGGGLSYLTIKNRTGFDIISASVDSWEGKEVPVSVRENSLLQVVHLIYAKPGVFSRIEGVERIRTSGTVDALFEYKTSGMTLGAATASAGRAGACVISGSTTSEIKEKAHKVFEEISVVGMDESDLTRRDLCLNNEMDAYEKRVLTKGAE